MRETTPPFGLEGFRIRYLITYFYDPGSQCTAVKGLGFRACGLSGPRGRALVPPDRRRKCRRPCATRKNTFAIKFHLDPANHSSFCRIKTSFTPHHQPASCPQMSEILSILPIFASIFLRWPHQGGGKIPCSPPSRRAPAPRSKAHSGPRESLAGSPFRRTQLPGPAPFTLWRAVPETRSRTRPTPPRTRGRSARFAPP